METITINKTQVKKTLDKRITLEDCNDVDNIAMISVDNTQTFENKDLNEPVSYTHLTLPTNREV